MSEKSLDGFYSELNIMKTNYVRLEAKVDHNEALQMQTIKGLANGIEKINKGFEKFFEKQEAQLEAIHKNAQEIATMKSFMKGIWFALGSIGLGLGGLVLRVFG